ncbi:MAG: Ribose transport system, ATP-binding protein RbsA [Bacillales bacterium]|jgi:ribose transport system ATP-binding protein|nr:Ribose transport system, ATP-binding protein RbsA [Bacillales bacterium]
MKIEMKSISKSFYGVQVLKKVDFTLENAEIHALMGENGAGKSTLLKILTGVYKRDEGTILVDGVEKVYNHPIEAEKDGIVFIHQELNILPNLTVLENLFLGKEIKNSLGVINKKKMEEKAKTALKTLNVNFPLDMLAGELSVGKQQMIEIAKALLVDAKLIIMDEPTAALTEQETSLLFNVIRDLQAKGVSFIYISHRMEEIFEVCDVISILRDGVHVMNKKISETDFDEVVRSMVGREIGDRFPKLTNTPEENSRLEVENLTKKGLFENVSFYVKKGEILGVSGLMGAGRTELAHAIFGSLKYDSGTTKINGEKVKIKSPIDAKNHGIAFITEDRKSEGLILDFSIEDNILLADANHLSKFGVLKQSNIEKRVNELIKKINIKTNTSKQPVKSLSGGNQQKVVFAKWLQTKPDILILDEPTRGVDVGAKKEIYNIIIDLASQGVSVILISSDLPEVISLSNRVMVMHEGKIGGILQKEDATQENIMKIATGGN